MSYVWTASNPSHLISATKKLTHCFSCRNRTHEKKHRLASVWSPCLLPAPDTASHECQSYCSHSLYPMPEIWSCQAETPGIRHLRLQSRELLSSQTAGTPRILSLLQQFSANHCGPSSHSNHQGSFGRLVTPSRTGKNTPPPPPQITLYLIGCVNFDPRTKL